MTTRSRKIDPAHLGLNPMSRRLIACQAVCVVLSVAAYALLGLSFDWTGAARLFLVDAAILVTWLYLFRTPGKQKEWIMTETLFAFLLVLVLSHILAPAQYAATALNRPLIDPLLADGDARLGVHVPTLAAWVREHPAISTVLERAYFTLLWQFALTPALLGLYLRNREALWEYTFHFHFCAVVTVLALAIIPAQCAFQYYGFESTIDQSRFIRHFNGFRDGSLTVVRWNDLEGLVSMPSFHVAGALMVTWAFRRHWLVLPLLAVNSLLLAATFLTGAHYFVDILVTFGMFAASVAVYRRVGAPLLQHAARGAAAQGQTVADVDVQRDELPAGASVPGVAGNGVK